MQGINGERNMAVNCKDAIREALENLGGEGTIKQVKDYIVSKYGPRWKDISTAMADLTFPGSKSSTYTINERFLERVAKGRYRLRKEKGISAESSRKPKYEAEKFAVKRYRTVTFDFGQAENNLERKGQLLDLKEAACLTDLSSEKDHDDVQSFLEARNWEIETTKFPVSYYRLDAFKNKTAVEIERSLIDAIHRSLFRCIWSYHRNLLDVLVFIVPTYKEPKFQNVVRDLQAFEQIIPFSVYVVGVNKSSDESGDDNV